MQRTESDSNPIMLNDPGIPHDTASTAPTELISTNAGNVMDNFQTTAEVERCEISQHGHGKLQDTASDPNETSTPEPTAAAATQSAEPGQKNVLQTTNRDRANQQQHTRSLKRKAKDPLQYEAYDRSESIPRLIGPSTAKREAVLARRCALRRNGQQPVRNGNPINLVAKAKATTIRRDEYREALNDVSEEKLTQTQIDHLKYAKEQGPNYLGRTDARRSGDRFCFKFRTTGFTDQNLLMPSADTWAKYPMHASIADFSQGELMWMVGNRLIWKNLQADEFLSYSKDLLFLIVHALNRRHEGQEGITIQFFDRRKAKALDGSQAAFYPALEIYDAVEIPRWIGWDEWTKTKLHPRKFGHEYLSHGTIRYPDNTLRQASLEDLIRDGLFQIFPPFDVPEDHQRPGLYEGQVAYRRIGFPPPEVPGDEQYPLIYSYDQCSTFLPITLRLLEVVRQVSLNFLNPTRVANLHSAQPPLHIFLSFLTFEKRKTEDLVFMEWIKDHYTAFDVADLYTTSTGTMRPGFTTVADNLPGCMQYLDLVRDCCTVFSLPRIPANVVETQHPFDGTMSRDYTYAAMDHRRHATEICSNPYDVAQRNERRKKDALKRRTKKEKEQKEREEKKEKELEVSAEESTQTPHWTLLPVVLYVEGKAAATNDEDDTASGEAPADIQMSEAPDGEPEAAVGETS